MSCIRAEEVLAGAGAVDLHVFEGFRCRLIGVTRGDSVKEALVLVVQRGGVAVLTKQPVQAALYWLEHGGQEVVVGKLDEFVVEIFAGSPDGAAVARFDRSARGG